MADKIYVGNGKERTFDNGGSVITITVDVDALINACKDYGFTTEAGKRKIRLKVAQRREIDQYGNSHLVEVDTWKPEQGRQSSQSSAPAGGYQKRPANATATPSRASQPDQEPPDFPDQIPF